MASWRPLRWSDSGQGPACTGGFPGQPDHAGFRSFLTVSSCLMIIKTEVSLVFCWFLCCFLFLPFSGTFDKLALNCCPNWGPPENINFLIGGALHILIVKLWQDVLLVHHQKVSLLSSPLSPTQWQSARSLMPMPMWKRDVGALELLYVTEKKAVTL